MEVEQQPNPENRNNDNEEISKRLELEGQQNLADFFRLLLKVDMRINPHNYVKTNASEGNGTNND